jgi:hypothetical protein
MLKKTLPLYDALSTWLGHSCTPTTLNTFQDYGLRLDIKETFLDDPSNGWNIQRSEIGSVVALSRL